MAGALAASCLEKRAAKRGKHLTVGQSVWLPIGTSVLGAIIGAVATIGILAAVGKSAGGGSSSRVCSGVQPAGARRYTITEGPSGYGK